jgi:hypothetical protein
VGLHKTGHRCAGVKSLPSVGSPIADGSYLNFRRLAGADES